MADDSIFAPGSDFADVLDNPVEQNLWSVDETSTIIDDDDNGPVPIKIAMGITLLVLQTCCSLYGITLQRLAHIRYEELARGLVYIHDLKFWRRPRVMWWTGLTLFIGSQFLMPFALALAPMSLLAPLSCVQILINLILAYTILQEEITKRDLMATFLSGGFAFGVLIFGPKGDNTEISTVSDIVANISGWGLIFMCIALGITCTAIFFYIPRFRREWERSKYIIIPWLHCSLATFGMIFTKGLGTQIVQFEEALENGGIGEPLWQLIITLIAIGCMSPASAYFQVAATSEFDNRWFIPCKFALTVVLQLFLGAAAFKEWHGLPTWRIATFLAFSFCCIGSVMFVSAKNSLQEKLDAAQAEKNGQADTKLDDVDIQMAVGKMDDDNPDFQLGTTVSKVPESLWFPVNFEDAAVEGESTTDADGTITSRENTSRENTSAEATSATTPKEDERRCSERASTAAASSIEIDAIQIASEDLDAIQVAPEDVDV